MLALFRDHSSVLIGVNMLTVIAFILAHIMSLGVLLGSNDTRSLFGQKNYLLNRYYSTQTMHLHKVNGPQFKFLQDVGVDPMHWDALGLIIPAVDEDAQIRHYPIGNSSHEGVEYLLLNGESLSVLSEISPSVYFATLLLIYLLSSVRLVIKLLSTVYRKYTGNELQPGDKDKIDMLTYPLGFIILLVYFIGVLSTYAGEPLSKITTFNVHASEKVYYETSSHMASILVCTITLFFYLLHVRGANHNWFASGYDCLCDNTDGGSKTPADTADLADTPRARNSVMLSVMHVPESGLHSTSKRSYGLSLGTSLKFSGFERYINEHPKHNNNGPYSSEISVLVAVTIFLGGVGNLGLTRGVLLETEAQFVLAVVLGFAVFEVASHRLEAYFHYLFANLTETKAKVTKYLNDDMKAMSLAFFNCVTFIRVVIVFIQVWLLVVYDNLISEIGHTYSACERAVFVVVVIHLAVKGLYILHRFVPEAVSHKVEELIIPIWNPRNIYTVSKILEIIYFVVAFFVIFSVLFQYATADKHYPDDSLEMLEKMQYGKTTNILENTNCVFPGKYKEIKLLQNEIHRSSGGASDWTHRDRWITTEVDPVDLKVYFWSKHWNVEPVTRQSTAKWFCRNGFEHHWRSCQNAAYEQPAPAVQSVVTQSIKLF